MADTKLTIFQADGTTAAIDYRSESTNGDGRQVITIGDPAINNNVVVVATQDATLQNQSSAGLAVRVAGSLTLGPSSNAIGIITSISSTVGINIGKVDGTIQVNVGRIDDSVQIKGTSTTLAVYLPDTGHEIGSIRGIANSINVYVGATAGTIVVKNDPASYNLVNAFHTASIFTVSGSVTGVSASGNTIISPSANASFKIFAFSLSSTAQSNVLAKFTNGAGTSPTEYWRLPLWAPTQGVMGANLAVTPPGYLWATGVSTTLSLLMDTGSLIHYSISYIKESA